MKRNTMKEAKATAGWRESYAMDNGRRYTVYHNGEKCYTWKYSKSNEYQDANGATYNTVRKSWIA